MFISLLLVTFLIALAVSTIIAVIFAKPIKRIMFRIIPDDISRAWVQYLMFAIYVVGIAGGVRIYQLERYITPRGGEDQILTLTTERWLIEVYSTIIGTLGSLAWMLLVFFIFALIAYVIIRAFELFRKEKSANQALFREEED